MSTTLMNISGIPYLEFRKGKDNQNHKPKSEFEKVLEKEEKKDKEKQRSEKSACNLTVSVVI